MSDFVLHRGDCVETMRGMADASVDSIVTDPPYGLGFMGKKWDVGTPAVDVFVECLRVLKPGGHLLAFGGTRTSHRLVCAIEDAGFEIRDTIAWVYGSGFPKSQNVSKAIDKAAGAERTEVRGVKPGHESFAGRGTSGVKRDGGSQGGEGGFHRPWMEDEDKANAYHQDFAPATEAAAQWDGWGTALKPAMEPICVARKPLAGTVAANVTEHGTGALNIDGCRVSTEGEVISTPQSTYGNREGVVGTGAMLHGSSDERMREAQRASVERANTLGRWPANLIHDGSDEVLEAFPESKDGVAVKSNTPKGKVTGYVFQLGNTGKDVGYGGAGSAARFFYCAKASRKDRNEGCEALDERPLNWSSGTQSPGTFQAEGTHKAARNNHPTVKPTELMRYLCRLVTPPGGVVLDPFMGSGSTGKAAVLEGFRFVGCEVDADYIAIARARISAAYAASLPDWLA